MHPVFSIIVPVYNAGNTLDRCIESILHQFFTDFELILVNDGSTDNCCNICIKYLSDSRVRLINQENMGVSCARNRGLTESLGDYIIFVDADDYVSQIMCSTYINVLSSNKCDLVIANYFCCTEKIGPVEKKLPIDLFDRIYSLNDFREIFGLLYKNLYIGSVWAKCYKKERIMNRFDRTINLGEDLIFNISFIAKCDSIYFSRKSLYYYCIQDSMSLSSKYRHDGIEMLHKVYVETSKLIISIWSEAAIFREISEKYVADCCNMAEKLIRNSINSDGCKELRKHFDLYELQDIFSSVSVRNYGWKWEFDRIFLQHRLFGLFSIFTKIIHAIKTYIARSSIMINQNYTICIMDRNENPNP